MRQKVAIGPAPEACAARGKTLVVADRPDPLMLTPPDGPLLDPACASFVGLIPAPFCFGMTPGETALFLRDALKLDALDLRVSPCLGLSRSQSLRQIYPSWHATSPAIVSLENADDPDVQGFWIREGQVDVVDLQAQ